MTAFTQLRELTHLTDLAQLPPVKRISDVTQRARTQPWAQLKAGLNGLKARVRSWSRMPQNPVTILAPLEHSKESRLRQLLEKIDQDTANNAILPFEKFGEKLHFARLLILEGPDHPDTYASSLVFLANVDGPVEDFLQQVVEVAAAGLDEVFGTCRDYPPKRQRTEATRRAFLQAHLVTDQAYYINTVGRTVRQIRQEDELHRALRSFLNDLERPLQLNAKTMRQVLVDYVASRTELSWALQPAERPGLLWRLKEELRFALILAGGAVVVLWSWPVLALWLLNIDRLNRQDDEDRVRPPLGRLTQLRAREDILVQNQFAAVGFVKPGWVRGVHTRALLALGQVGFRHIFNKGDLATVPLLKLQGVNTIHFAHWIFIEDRQRLLFASNYDGSLESYMVDFIDKVAWGINLVFSNGVGFPRTIKLVREGARKEQLYKDYLGNHQIETLAWHSPYPQLTAVNVANNEAIRAGLRGYMTERQARAWLRRIN